MNKFPVNLEDISLNSKTELCNIMCKFGSDKGDGWHNYTIIYDYLFKDLKNEQLNIFEVGLGTNNTYIPSNMGISGKPGASLYGWREYFSKANIYGGDIDLDILFESDRIKTYYVDQLNSTSIKDMWNLIDVEFDIIIDDGLHSFEANCNFLINSINKLKNGGIFIIEDIVRDVDNIIKFSNQLSSLKLNFQIINIPNCRNKHDNVLILITK